MFHLLYFEHKNVSQKMGSVTLMYLLNSNLMQKIRKSWGPIKNLLNKIYYYYFQTNIWTELTIFTNFEILSVPLVFIYFQFLLVKV